MYIHYEELMRKNIILYGVGKFQQDVEDFFYELNVSFYIDDRCGFSSLHEKKVFSIHELSKDRLSNSLIIICDFDYNEKKSHLESLGLEYKRDFILGIDLINILEERETFELVNYAPNKKIIVLGTGLAAKQLMYANPHLQVHYFIDNDRTRWGETFFNRPVKNVDELLNENMNEVFVLAATNYVSEVKEQLINMGLEFGKDFYFFDSMDMNNPARLLEETIKSNPHYICGCDYEKRLPVQVGESGSVKMCCGKIKIQLGNILFNTFTNIDNSVYAKVIRLGIINRTYALCKKDVCIFLMSEKNRVSSLEDGEVKRAAGNINSYTLFKAKIQPAYDNTCNYKCKSCRDHIIVRDYENDSNLKQIHEEFIKMLPKIKRLNLAGRGEVFASKYYKEILFEKYKNDSVNILTNASLLNREVCSRLLNKYKDIALNISIHAAKPETYEKLHSADFNVVYNNLKMIAGIRTNNNQIRRLLISFVFQKDNFREMVDFIELGMELNADLIAFRPIMKWPVISDEKYMEINVYDPMNPYHKEFLEVISNPLFNNPKVRLGGN